MPRVLSCLSGLLIASLALAGSIPDEARHYQGVAYAGSDGRELYREEHFVFEDASGVRSRLVIYRCPSGEPFARKWVRDVASDEAPDFELDDARFGYREGVRTIDGRREVFWRADRRSPLRVAPLPDRDETVIDAGFDAFVRHHWDRLSTPGATHINFVVPSRLGYVGMTIQSAAPETIAGEPVMHVRLGLDSWYGRLLPSIDLSYDMSDHRLRRFEGLSNILDAAGRREDVRIEFPLSSVSAPPDRHEIDRAAAVALTTKCSP